MPSSYLGVRDEQTVGVLVLAGNLILRQHVSQLLDEGDHFLVPRHVSHGETAGRAFPTVRHSLQTHEHMIRSKAQKRARLCNLSTHGKRAILVQKVQNKMLIFHIFAGF